MTHSTPFPVPATGAPTLRLLGRPLLLAPGGRPAPLERKAAALLAYLAVEGAARRAALITLLWPDTREAAARNNLVHLLRKLAVQAGRPVVEGRETLSLAPDVEVDLAAPVLTGADLSRPGAGLLLGTCTYDDCPELDDWLRAERERLEEWALLSLRAEAEHLEQLGDHAAALRCARRLADLDPLSEDACQRLMRLHARHGDRHRALRAYERLCAALRRELSAEPLPETAALALAVRGSGESRAPGAGLLSV